MKLVRQQSPDDDPEWEYFAISATNFRPHWDGDLVNVFTSIRPKEDIDATQEYAIDCARQIAGWIIKKRQRFSVEDRFQIIIGWPKDLRSSGRQIIKTGGGFGEIERIASGAVEVVMRGNWSAQVH